MRLAGRSLTPPLALLFVAACAAPASTDLEVVDLTGVDQLADDFNQADSGSPRPLLLLRPPDRCAKPAPVRCSPKSSRRSPRCGSSDLSAAHNHIDIGQDDVKKPDRTGNSFTCVNYAETTDRGRSSEQLRTSVLGQADDRLMTNRLTRGDIAHHSLAVVPC